MVSKSSLIDFNFDILSHSSAKEDFEAMTMISSKDLIIGFVALPYVLSVRIGFIIFTSFVG